MDPHCRYQFVQRQLTHTLSKLQRSLQESQSLATLRVDHLADWKNAWRQGREQIARRLELLEDRFNLLEDAPAALQFNVVGLPDSAPAEAAC